ncbi:MAG: CapA family protein [Chloroflexi bacterium]|nr:CapA family protein [Chloroflexota bacterium]
MSTKYTGEKSTVTILAVGDMGPYRPDPKTIFEPSAELMRSADITFGQLERILSDRGCLQMTGSASIRVPPGNVEAFTYMGCDVISVAGNKATDWGAEGLLDTIEVLQRNGIKAIGTGRNVAQATEPATFDCKGTRIAFLGYSCVTPPGHEATEDKAGVASVRISTFYEAQEYQAGTPPRIITFPNADDLKPLLDNVRKAKAAADIVVLSLHWGIHLISKVIAQYQPIIGHAAIDAGADLILGHHAHILKGIEVYRGKVIFYSLCNFGMEAPEEQWLKQRLRHMYRWEIDPAYPRYAYPPDTRRTVVAKIVIRNKRIERVSFLPAYINGQAQPVVQRERDPRFEEVVQYVKDISDDFKTGFQVDGDEVVVTTG